ncbi:hypothetical protein VIRA109638_06125 [Vibrio rarus]
MHKYHTLRKNEHACYHFLTMLVILGRSSLILWLTITYLISPRQNETEPSVKQGMRCPTLFTNKKYKLQPKSHEKGARNEPLHSILHHQSAMPWLTNTLFFIDYLV